MNAFGINSATKVKVQPGIVGGLQKNSWQQRDSNVSLDSMGGFNSVASPDVRIPESILRKNSDFYISTKANLADTPEHEKEPTTAIILTDKKIDSNQV